MDIEKGDAWLVSARLQPWQKKIVSLLRVRAPVEKGVLWLLSSGTQSVDQVKAIALTYDAFKASARAVNQHLDVRKSDRWLITLPLYHVGGLSILTRAHLSHSGFEFLKNWDALKFAQSILDYKITLTSLVPTQVHDLVTGDMVCPVGLRAVVVGGGSLDPGIYRRARELGWPLLPSYGLTECCSQVATATMKSLERRDFPQLEVLSHVELELREQRIFLKSPALAKWIAKGDREGQFSLEDPLRDGWLPTEDLAEWDRRGLKLLGRRDDVVKILGVLVPVQQVEHEARAFFLKKGLSGDIAVVALAGGREENRLVLVTDSGASLREWEMHLQSFNEKVPGPHRIKQFVWTSSIPRGELGKVNRLALATSLGL